MAISRFSDIAGILGVPLLQSETKEVEQSAPTKSLSERTEAALKETFEKNGHSPSLAQWQGLRDLIAHLDAMAEGKAHPLYYLSPLDPGVGKSQSIIHFVRELLKSDDHRGVSVLICLGRLAEIKPMIEQMGLEKEDLAVLVQDSTDEGVTGERQALLYELNTIGNPEPRKARVLFTTQQMLTIRTKRSGSFEAADEFHYQGEPRQVRIWDEAILPGRAMRIDVSVIHEMLKPANYIKPLYDGLGSLIDEIEGLDHDDDYVIPDLEAWTGVDLNDAEALYSTQSRGLREAVYDLWMMSGKPVVVQKSGARNTFIHYEDTLPDDLKPAVVCDASGRVRQTYTYWEKGRGDLVRLRGAGKNYKNLTLHIWRRGGGKESWKGGNDSQELIDGIIQTVNEKPGERFLIVHHMKGPFVQIDIPDVIRRKTENPSRLKFAHWGGSDFKATNDYRDVENVILAGTLFYDNGAYIANARMATRLDSQDRVDPQVLAKVRMGEHADLILQALCRGAVRKSDGESCGKCDAYVIASVQTGIPDMLEGRGDIDIFPGSKTVDWFPVERELSGHVRTAVAVIVSHFEENPRERLKSTTVRDWLGLGANDWNANVIQHKDFQAVLSTHDIHLRKARGRGGSHFELDR